ncbi:MAG: glycosyltransferase, partial [Verrucomicrobiota bacterium]|nr:glycosyltransferase [Verrucomicrobiota bacterium]
MPTRILYISRSADLAGSERQLALILRGLDRKRFEPLVLCPGEGSFTQLLRSAGEQVLVVPPLTGLRKLTFPIFVLPRLLRREGIDLIHLHATRFCSIGGRLAGVPVVEAITMSRAIPQAFLSRRPWADRIFSSFPRVLLVPSQHQRDELIARGIPASKIHVLYNSVWPQLHT